MTSKTNRSLAAMILALSLGLGSAACAEKPEANEAAEGSMTAGQTAATADTDDEENEGGEEGEENEGAAESAEALAREAKIAEPVARKTALAEVPGGVVESFELEREGGKLLYSYDIKMAGKTGIDEVQIDALTGALLSNKHETPEDEAKEAAKDAATKT